MTNTLPCKQGMTGKGLKKKKKPKLAKAGVIELSIAVLYFGAKQYSTKLKINCIDHPKCFQANAIRECLLFLYFGLGWAINFFPSYSRTTFIHLLLI